MTPVSDLLGPAANASPSLTPAKAANLANREHPCGLSADSGSAKALRKSANPRPQSAEAAPESQIDHGPQSKQRRGFSQDSQDSQGLDPTTVDRWHLMARDLAGERLPAPPTCPPERRHLHRISAGTDDNSPEPWYALHQQAGDEPAAQLDSTTRGLTP